VSNEWDFYRLRVDHQPASIMVDLGIRSSVPLQSYIYMGYLRTHMNSPQPNGLSSQEEFDNLCEIGDAIDHEIETSDGRHLYVGRNTSSNNRDFYFYTSDLQNLKQVLHAITQKFPDYQFEQGGREDLEWSTYLNFLYPNPSQLQQIMDRRVCEQLESQGDDLSIERPIDHRVYFSDKSQMKIFQSYLHEKKYIDIQTGKTKLINGKHFIDFKHIGAPQHIYDIVYDLFYKSDKLEGLYDGWGCSVMKPN